MNVLLVTGASRGIGAEISRQAASEGWKVAVNYASSRIQADSVVDEIRSNGGDARSFQADISNENQVMAMFNKIDAVLGPVTGLVNNAGINGNSVRVDDLDAKVTSRLFEVNILGYFICAKWAIRRMAKRHYGNGGSIVNISSAAAKHGGPGSYIDYATSKGAIDTFTVGLAKEQADQGIRVNCLRPGITMTELSLEFAKENPEWEQWALDQIPLKRTATMKEIADAALFLLSDKSSYVTGAILDASGGWVSP